MLNFGIGAGTGSAGVQFTVAPTQVTQATTGILSGAYFTDASGRLDFVAAPSAATNLAALGSTTALVAATGSGTTNYLLAADLTTTGNVVVNSLRINGAATLTLAGNLSVTSTSATVVGGILHDNAGGAATITGNFGVTTSTANNELVLITGGTNNANALTIASNLTNGSGVVTKGGSGTLVLSGANTFTGNFFVNEGTLRLTGSNATLGAGAGNTLFLRAGTDLQISQAGALASPFTNATQVRTLESPVLNAAGTISLVAAGAQAIRVNSSASGVLSSVLADGAGQLSFFKSGGGTQALTGLNTYTGITVLTAGTLDVTSLADGGLPSSIGQSSSAAANLVFNGGTLNYTGSSATIFQTTQTPSTSTDRLFTLAANGTIQSNGSFGGTSTATPGGQNNATLIFSNTGDVAFANGGARTLTLRGNSTGDNEFRIRLTNNTVDSTLLSLSKIDAGLWVLNPLTSNTYSGETSVTGGALRALLSGPVVGVSATSLLTLNGGVLETSGTVTRSLGAVGGNVRLTGGASGFSAATPGRLVVTLGGGAVTWGSANFSPSSFVLGSGNTETEFTNDLALNAAARTVTVTANARTGAMLTSGILSGVISGTVAGDALVKSGGGVLILGNANTYSGNTRLDDGTIVVTSIGTGTSSSLGASGAFVINTNNGDRNALIYVGAGEVANRDLTLQVSGNFNADRTLRIESSGAGALVWNAGNFTNTTRGDTVARTTWFELRGFNTDYNQMNLVLTNSTNATFGNTLAISKNDGGVWVLNPPTANTFTGRIDVNGGPASEQWIGLRFRRRPRHHPPHYPGQQRLLQFQRAE